MTIHIEQPDWQVCASTEKLQLTNAIDIWQIPLLEEIPTAADLELLSADEQARYERYLDAISRRSFVSSRLAMYQLFSIYLDKPAESISISQSLQGKPRLHARDQQLFFNLSHSREQILLAVSGGLEVGIDVEQQRAVANWQAIATKVFDQALFGELRHSGRPEQDFIGLWTEFEAQQKLFGTGVFGQRIEPSPAVEIVRFSPAENYQAALAFPSVPDQPELHFFNYQFDRQA